MADKLTPQQAMAVTDRGGKLLVSAAAGSGKTKVLVDRLLRYLTDPNAPANLDEFLIITYTKAAAAELSRAVQDGAMVKEYLAMIHGVPEKQGDWTDYLFKDSRKNKVFVVKKERKGVKLARLEFSRLRSGEKSLVHVRLHTGRSHQIRVQFASRGFPLVGDHKYGSRDEAAAPMLYSCRIRFPWGDETKVFECFPEWCDI